MNALCADCTGGAESQLGTWDDLAWESLLAPTMADEATRKVYN